MGRLQAAARRRRHVVLLRGRAPVVPHGRAAARRRRSTRSRPTCATRSSPSRITASTRHFGIDPIGLGRAVWRDVRGGGRLEGGSTLTQQLARTLFLSNKRTPARKAQEAVIALLLEQELSKKQILELYLNRIYLSGGVYGVETMSQNLYGKPASRLTLPEASLIAGLIRAPSALSPWSNLDGALDRSRVVLQRMREEGFITAGAGEGGGAGAAADPSVSRAPPKRGTATRRSSCGSSSAIGSAAIIRPTGRCGRRSCRNCRKRRSARSRTGCAASATPICRRRWSRSIRRPATCSRWSADATSGSRSSTARGAAAASPGRRSSRSSMPRRWRRAIRR